MLVLAVHTVADQSAKVPFSAVLLKEMAASNDRMPAELRMRQLLPTSGPIFTSLWDAPSTEAVQSWLDSNVNVHVTHRVFEVHEAFALGLGDVVRQRAGDQLAAGATAVGTQVKSAAKDIDDRLHLSEKTAGAVEAVRESGVAKSLVSARRSAVSAAQRVVESERYQVAATAASNQVRRFQSAFSSWKDRAFKKTGARGQAGVGAGAAAGAYAPLDEPSEANAFSPTSNWGEAPAAAATAPPEYAAVTLSSPPVAYDTTPVHAESLQTSTEPISTPIVEPISTPATEPVAMPAAEPASATVSESVSTPDSPEKVVSPPPAAFSAASSPPTSSSPPPASPPTAASPPPAASSQPPTAQTSAGASFSLDDDES